MVTNAHVVGDSVEVQVYFPYFFQGKPLRDRDYYLKNVRALTGKVVARDEARDLALVEVAELPPGYRALPLSSQSARPGQRLHIVGNSRVGGGKLWYYRTTEVTDTVAFTVATTADADTIAARFVRMDPAAVDPGDSGSPVLNDAGQIVGVVAVSGSLWDGAIDVQEVHRLLKRYQGVEQPTPTHGLSGDWRVTMLTEEATLTAGATFESDGTLILSAARVCTGRYRYEQAHLEIQLGDDSLPSVPVTWNGSDRFTIELGDTNLVFERN